MKTKQSGWPGVMAGAAGVGAGGFALGALYQEIARQRDAEAQRKRQQLPDNALVIDLPRPPVKQAEALPAEFLEKAASLMSMVNNILPEIGGATAGYMGAKTVYDAYKKKQSDQEIGAANLKYMQALQALQQKTAELNTPHVDQLCEAAAEQFQKSGGLEKVIPWAKKTLPWLVPGAVGVGATGLAANDLGAFDRFKQNPIQPTSSATGVLDAAKKMWLTTAVLTALGGAGAMIHANNKKTKRESAVPPSAVALNYEDLPPASALGGGGQLAPTPDTTPDLD